MERSSGESPAWHCSTRLIVTIHWTFHPVLRGCMSIFFFPATNSVLTKKTLETPPFSGVERSLTVFGPVRPGSSRFVRLVFLFLKYLIEQCINHFVPRKRQKPGLGVRGVPVISQFFLLFFRWYLLARRRTRRPLQRSRVFRTACATSHSVEKCPTGV